MRVNLRAILDVVINHHAESKKADSSPLSGTIERFTGHQALPMSFPSFFGFDTLRTQPGGFSIDIDVYEN